MHNLVALSRLLDVAKLAGVSIMTVSRALRAPGKVAPATLVRVQDAMAAIGYVPNLVAGTLAGGSSRVVAAIVPSIQNSLFASTIQGLQEALRAEGYALMLGDSGYSAIDEEELVRSFLGQRPAGLVLHATTHTPATRDMLARAGVPVVETGNLVPRPLDMVASYNNAAAARAMTLHLAGRGYQRIAFVSLPAAMTERARERRRGYRAGLRARGLTEDPALVIEAGQGFASGAEAVRRLMALPMPPDAAFFAGDVLALGALLECQRQGWAVPGRLAVAGFDDHEIATQVFPALTVLRVQRDLLGRQAAAMIFQRLRGESTQGGRFDCGFEVVQRNST